MKKDKMQDILDRLAAVAGDSLEYARRWKQQTGRPVIGAFPMHFPLELVHAAGALPLVIQEAEGPITDGEAAVFSFYCGYNRSVVDQAIKGEFKFLSGIMFGDHCVQLLGTADIVRWHDPNMRVLFNQFISSMDAGWAFNEARTSFAQLLADLEDMVGACVSNDSLLASIRLYNRDRQLMRELYDMRSGGGGLSARQMQHVVKSGMVMDVEEHIALLESLIAQLQANPPVRRQGMPVYLSGHLCQPPKLELLDIIENTGAIVVGDDLFHGYRFISTDIKEDGDALDNLARWYFDRNTELPSPTVADGDADWDDVIVAEAKRTGAAGVIVLVVKFCEPHMYYFPEVEEACREADLPLLRIETEHDSMPFEAFRTRLETFVEVARRRRRELV